MSMVSSRRTLYPPWRIPQYRTFQERMLTMVLGLHPEAKEKLLGIISASNTFLINYMRGPPAIFKHNLLIHTDLGILSMKQKTKRIQSFLGCFGRSAAVLQFTVYFNAAVHAHTNVDVYSCPLNLKGRIGSRFEVVTFFNIYFLDDIRWFF